MSGQLTRFRVVGLHGRRTMDVEIQDNKLILVGENGTGKSTFANLIYYFLSKQWRRLHDYRFSAVEAVLDGEELKVTPEQIDAHFTARQQFSIAVRRFSPHWSPGMRRSVISRLLEYTPHELLEEQERLLIQISEELRVPPRRVRELIEDYLKETKGKPTDLQVTEERISSLVKGQFLYLPTYRRIEQDLRSIFRGVEIEQEIREFKKRLSVRREGAPYIELVEFGMEDVEQTIADRMSQIKESVRNGLDNLTGTYLREVIGGVHTTVDVQRVREIDPKTLDAIFVRIDEATLPGSDKTRLKEKMAFISASREIQDEDKVIAHFLLKLIELYSEQQANERDVREFIDLCNGYLTGKQIIYDNTKYTIFIRLDTEASQSSETLEMKMLSSGEKQIVSLFSHLYLSGEKRFFVVIDEPELSLSVPWQRRFLPDIVKTGMCSGLIAVTHSPFVWENELEPSVRSLAEFTQSYYDIR